MQELAVLRLPRFERVLSCTSDSRSGLLQGKQPPDRRLPRPLYAPTAAEDRFALTLAAMQLPACRPSTANGAYITTFCWGPYDLCAALEYSERRCSAE